MKWFQVKEKSAGKKRLIVSWYLYKIFGKGILYFIGDCVSFVTFLGSSSLRKYAKKYFEITETYTGIKPNLKNIYKLIRAYAESLVDKILVFCGDFDKTNIEFENNEDEKELQNDISNKKGVFFICNHIGNIEVLQSYMLKNLDLKINMFMSRAQSRIFNDFLNSIKIKMPVKIYMADEIGLNTGIELEESLKRGDLVFIAGDRLAEKNDKKRIESELFSHRIYLPKGTFKLAKLMNVPTYFISVVKIDKKYKILLQKQSVLKEKEVIKSYTNFLEKSIKYAPFQFFHFYDFFIENEKNTNS